VKWRGIGYLPEESNVPDLCAAEDISKEATDASLLASMGQPDLFNLLHETIIIRDLSGRIVFWNTGAMEMYGWTQEEAIGAISHELLKTRFPQPLKDIERGFVKSGRWEGQLVHTKKCGSRIVVKSRWVLDNGSHGAKNVLIEVNRMPPLQ
jgi:PAS domain S-box-containing protein